MPRRHVSWAWISKGLTRLASLAWVTPAKEARKLLRQGDMSPGRGYFLYTRESCFLGVGTTTKEAYIVQRLREVLARRGRGLAFLGLSP